MWIFNRTVLQYILAAGITIVWYIAWAYQQFVCVYLGSVYKRTHTSCMHYILYGCHLLSCRWACSCQFLRLVVARRWERCGDWLHWLSGSGAHPWLPEKVRMISEAITISHLAANYIEHNLHILRNQGKHLDPKVINWKKMFSVLFTRLHCVPEFNGYSPHI